MKGADNSYASVVDLMNDVRDSAIARVRKRIDALSLIDERFRKIGVDDPNEARPRKEGSISVYIGVWKHSGAIGGENRFSDDGVELVVIIRLSDHKTKAVKSHIFLDVDDKILVRGKGKSGGECRWDELDWKTEKTKLINGDDVVLQDGRVITSAEFLISRTGKGVIVNDCMSRIIDSVYDFFYRQEYGTS